MKKWILRLSLSVMWLIGAHMWHDMSICVGSGTIVGNVFGSGSVVLYVIASAMLLNSVRYFKYWVESK